MEPDSVGSCSRSLPGRKQLPVKFLQLRKSFSPRACGLQRGPRLRCFTRRGSASSFRSSWPSDPSAEVVHKVFACTALYSIIQFPGQTSDQLDTSRLRLHPGHVLTTGGCRELLWSHSKRVKLVHCEAVLRLSRCACSPKGGQAVPFCYSCCSAAAFCQWLGCANAKAESH